MDKIKKFWLENKEKVKGFGYGVASTTVVAMTLAAKNERGHELTSYNVLRSTNPDTPEPSVLVLTHKNGKNTVMSILD